jgi:hypothetical protein
MVKFREMLCLLVFFSGFSFAGILGIEPYRDAQLVKSNSQSGQLVEIPLSKIVVLVAVGSLNQ